MLGPLVALAILAIMPDAFDVVFVCSFSIALCGLGVLVLFVRNPKSRASGPETSGVLSSLSEFRRALRDPRLLRLTVAATLLSAATVSDGFIYLVLQDQVGFNAGLFPLTLRWDVGELLGICGSCWPPRRPCRSSDRTADWVLFSCAELSPDNAG